MKDGLLVGIHDSADIPGADDGDTPTPEPEDSGKE